MPITLVAIGSRGDVQPLVALGAGLRRHGHQVRLVAGDEFGPLSDSAQLEYVPLGLNFQTALKDQTNLFRFMHSLTDRILKAAEGTCDALVATFMGVSAGQLARSRGVPFFYAVPMPGLQTGEFPSPLLPALPFGRAYNLLTYRMADRMITRSYAPARCLFQEPRPTYLFCFSPHVIPRPADWEAYAHITGYWFLDRAPTWQPPAGLEDFLQAGPPPLYVGFGSMLPRDAQKLSQLVMEALARTHQRGVLVSGWGGLTPATGAGSAEVFVADALPFDWLFPRVTIAIHHGGAGTTAAALRAGIPSLIIPFGMDQSFWGRQVKRLGVGTDPLPLQRLTAQRLAAAIQHLLTDPAIRARASQLGEKIRGEDGVENAVRIIEQEVAAQRNQPHHAA